MPIKPVKLLSAWVGGKPKWYDKFVDQMSRMQTVDWEIVPPPGDWNAQVNWMNDRVREVLGTVSRKGTGRETVEAVCDLRPTYGELFADRYAGYEWWGWCDLDMAFGRVDELLPPLLSDDVDAVTFKTNHLSGCLSLFRNKPEVTGAFRHDPWREILADYRYHLWDESGYKYMPGVNMFNLLNRLGLRVKTVPELYGYTAREIKNPHCVVDGKLMTDDREGRREVLFCHFMDDEWPL